MDKNDVIFWFAQKGKHPNFVDALLEAVDHYGVEVIVDLLGDGRYLLSTYWMQGSEDRKYKIDPMPTFNDI